MTIDTDARPATPLVTSEEKARVFAGYLNEPRSERLRPRTIEEAQAHTDRWALREQLVRAQRQAEHDERVAAMREAHSCRVCGDAGADTGDMPKQRLLAGRPFASCSRCYSVAQAVLVEQEPPTRIAAVRHALAEQGLTP